ncbi:MAG TPA: tetrahydrofolate dehydrogenase/cyclohydrolase catalytic domain-containing protein, partial [Gemmatimonadaceae bacterium]
MPAELIDGAAIAREVRAEAGVRAAELAAEGVVPGLTVVLVGDDPASAVYVRAKGRACDELGLRGDTIRLPAETSQQELLELIDRLNEDDAVHGILVQMPVPKQIDPDTVIQRISPDKDVDGFPPVNVGNLLIGNGRGFAPCTPAGVLELIRRSGVETRGAECVIVGRSNIVGKPMAALMMQPGVDSTVTVCHSRSRDLPGHVRRADILIAAVGRAEMITG